MRGTTFIRALLRLETFLSDLRVVVSRKKTQKCNFLEICIDLTGFFAFFVNIRLFKTVYYIKTTESTQWDHYRTFYTGCPGPFKRKMRATTHFTTKFTRQRTFFQLLTPCMLVPGRELNIH